MSLCLCPRSQVSCQSCQSHLKSPGFSDFSTGLASCSLSRFGVGAARMPARANKGARKDHGSQVSVTGTRARCRGKPPICFNYHKKRQKTIILFPLMFPTPPSPGIWLLCPSQIPSLQGQSVFAVILTLCCRSRRPFCDWFSAKRQTFAADDCNKQHFVLQNEAFRMFFASLLTLRPVTRRLARPVTGSGRVFKQNGKPPC